MGRWPHHASPWCSEPGARSGMPSTPACWRRSTRSWAGTPAGPTSSSAHRRGPSSPRSCGPGCRRPTWLVGPAANRCHRPAPPSSPRPSWGRRGGRNLGDRGGARCRHRPGWPGPCGHRGTCGRGRWPPPCSRRDACRRPTSPRRSTRSTATPGPLVRCGSSPWSSIPVGGWSSGARAPRAPPRPRPCGHRAPSRPTSSRRSSTGCATSTAACTPRRTPTSSPTRLRTWC